jgi:protoporphyrinogen oxidase
MLDAKLNRDERVVILGAGPTGLGAAYRLHELGFERFHVYDQASQVGGLATSHVDPKGFTWDIGGHVQFSHYRYFDRLMVEALGDQWLHHQRESWVWIEDRFVPYPFQNNIRYLKPQTMWKCVQGLIKLYKNPITAKPANFAQWIQATFGTGLADVFMVPYNFKVWAYPAEQMDYNWIGERVAVTDLERLIDNVLHHKDDLSWGPNNTFQFPKFGGTGAIWKSVANRIGDAKISLNKQAVRIDAAAKKVHFSDGSHAEYEVLISALPIDVLVELAQFKKVASAASSLKYSSSNIFGIGLTGKPREEMKKKCWMYFPESNCPFYRVTLFSNYSPNNVPGIDKYWSLMAEVSESPHKPVDQAKLLQQVIDGFFATKLIDSSHEIVSTWKYRAHHGYPTPTPGRDQALNEIHEELLPHRIYSRGRFGGWKYEVSNQDHSLMQGVELVDKLALGVPELTYWYPNVANDLRYAKQR